AGAQVIGVGIIIEKSFQDGRQLLIDAGVPVTSLARIEKFQDGQVVFAPADI
ncbi:xanthine phosphoribosyltransferase, partial [Enterococcus casseliflavus]